MLDIPEFRQLKALGRDYVMCLSPCMQLGKLKEAIHDCTQAVELNPDYIKAYQRRAKL